MSVAPERPAGADDEQPDRPGPDDRDPSSTARRRRDPRRAARPRAPRAGRRRPGRARPGRARAGRAARPSTRAARRRSRRSRRSASTGTGPRARPGTSGTSRTAAMGRRRPGPMRPSSPDDRARRSRGPGPGRALGSVVSPIPPSPTSACPSRTARRRRPGRGPRRARVRVAARRATTSVVGGVEPGDEHRRRDASGRSPMRYATSFQRSRSARASSSVVSSMRTRSMPTHRGQVGEVLPVERVGQRRCGGSRRPGSRPRRCDAGRVAASRPPGRPAGAAAAAGGSMTSTTVDDHPESVAEVGQRADDRRPGMGIEDEPDRVGLAADRQRVDLQARLAPRRSTRRPRACARPGRGRRRRASRW